MKLMHESSWMSRLGWLAVLVGSCAYLYYWFALRNPERDQVPSVSMTRTVDAIESVLEIPKPAEPLLDLKFDAPPGRPKPRPQPDVNPKPEPGEPPKDPGSDAVLR